MGTLDAEAVAIIADVRRAFAGVRRGEITLHEAEVIDHYGTDEERAAARLLDPDGPWEEVPDGHIAGSMMTLPHLDPESWRYYTPAHMSWSLRHEDDRRNIVHDFTLYTFGIDPGLVDYKLARFETLTPDQATAVTRFLRYRAAGDSGDPYAERALAEYWGRLGTPDHGYRPSDRW